MPSLPDLRAAWPDLSAEERLCALVEYDAAHCPGDSERHRGYHDALQDMVFYVLEGHPLPDPAEEAAHA